MTAQMKTQASAFLNALCFIIPGLVAGIIISYWIQPGFVRMTLGLPEYLQKIIPLLFSPKPADVPQEILTNFLACAVLGIFVGAITAYVVSRRT